LYNIYICKKKNKDNLTFLAEIGKLEKQDIKIENDFEDSKEKSQLQLEQNIDNSYIIVFNSDFCGLGKTFKIKKMIEKKSKIFPFSSRGNFNKKSNIKKNIKFIGKDKK